MESRGQQSQPRVEGSSPTGNRSVAQRIERHFGRRILSGFLVLVPLLATLLILSMVFGYVDGIFRGQGGVFTPFIDQTILDFPGIGVIFAVILLYSVGLLLVGRAGRRAIGWQKIIFSKIPVVRSIYGVAQQATDALTSPTGHRYSRVVFLYWPRPDVLAMGFVTGYCQSPANPSETVVSVYIPTVPNPTSGMLAFVSEDDIFESPLTVEDAMKIVFSGGIVLPNSMQISTDKMLVQPRGDS